MSYNRATQQPCIPTCCMPATYSIGAASWDTQNNAAKMYNLDACKGLQAETFSVTYEATSVINTTGSPENDCCTLTGWDTSFSYTEQSGGSTDTCISGDWEVSCSPSCPDPPCASGVDCGASSNETQYTCFPCSTFTDTGCDGTGTGALMYSKPVACATSTIDADWYASGMTISGNPENFIGYPTEIDECIFWRKGLRGIFARKASGAAGSVDIRWYFAKEWMNGAPANLVKFATITAAQNELALVSASIDLNTDIGITCTGGGNAVFRTLRLGGGGTAGDGSFGEGSGWYDITDTPVEFYYTKPSYSQCTTGFGASWECDGACPHCCNNLCGCADAGINFKSPEARILTSADVENSAGDCVWDATPSGANFSGSWAINGIPDGMFNDSAMSCTGGGAGGTCSV